MPGVYISYPFCAQKCTYCNFASGVFPRESERRYIETLRREIGAFAFAWRPETVYLGGGTPSAMSLADLRGVLDLVPGKMWIEATIEAAPGSITREKAEAWRAAGINRVSLGVQSFIDKELARTGRKHNAAIVAAEVALLRECGLGNINIDLIAGLSGQTRASWRESLDWIERLAPPHVSVYMLEIDMDSRLGTEMVLGGKRYGAGDVPAEELTAELYETAVECLARLGIRRYEISNFARPGMESRHNLKYWKREPYVGFGVDAHSFDGHNRRANPETLAEYLDNPSSTAEPANPGEERFFVGLRLAEGIRLDAADRERFEEPIARLEGAGLVETEGEVLRLTDRGVLFSNEVFQEFIA